MLDALPPETKIDILTRLPIDSLLRLRAVSKPWCARIDDPQFAKAHLIRSIQTNSNLALIFADADPRFLFKLDFPSLHTAIRLPSPLNHPSYSDPNITWAPGFSPHLDTRLLGSSHGLLCFSNAFERHFLLNPSTRKFKVLPVLATPMEADYVSSTYAFGYDPASDDYKVVRLAQYCNLNGSYFRTETMVYDLKANAWREVPGMPYALGIDFGGKGFLVGHSLNWLVVRTQDHKAIRTVPNLIVGFDLTLEEYSALVLPDAVAESKFNYIKLKLVGEWLSVVAIYEPVKVDVWVMKEYGVVESWTKFFSVSMDKLSSLKCMATFAFSSDGDEILLEMLPGNLVWYNLKAKCIKVVEMHSVVHPITAGVFHESLVSLGHGEETIVKNVAKKEPETGKKTQDRNDFLSKMFKLVL